MTNAATSASEVQQVPVDDDWATPPIDELAPGCTVRFDDLAGCGVNVYRRRVGPSQVLVDLTFLSHRTAEVHSLTLVQADQLRAALDALVSTELDAADPLR